MKFFVTSALLALAGLAAAEVPQEHSHEFYLLAMDKLLQDNNPLEIKSSVFALLGNAAAAEASDKVNAADLDCLQQIVADQAFTNAKANNDVAGMVNSLIFRTLERNTLTVGEASKLCTTVKAVNPEIAALTQIQDPASPEASKNKQTILDLAVQIAAVGGDPTEALFAGTFAPGQIGDPTAAGNTCNDANDTDGCIFTQNLLVEEATVDEIEAAVAAGGAGNGNGGNDNNNAGNDNNNAGNDNNNAGNDNQNNNNGNNNQNNNNGNQNQGGASGNIQSFTGALGGAAPAVEFSAGADRPFTVNGNTFTTANAALTRSCDIQNNACFNAVNGGQLTGGTQQCQQQQQDCIASVAQSAAAVSKAKRDLKVGGRRLSRR
ncbi:hypothetical protein OOU_Y34scaffold00796g1 [Pyricularia oryzae Y34]|uniref:Uncharacterized protein n=2 Tax=Pyricularia oryzae TaxID=318829 RepID=A0AA97NPV8_PYRO3|nr:hypothetical protein OOU_Y34scaffold00796g1 [Pyricularia oryzae Y34]